MDVTGELLSHLLEWLLAAGVNDTWLTPGRHAEGPSWPRRTRAHLHRERPTNRARPAAGDGQPWRPTHPDGEARARQGHVECDPAKVASSPCRRGRRGTRPPFARMGPRSRLRTPVRRRSRVYGRTMSPMIEAFVRGETTTADIADELGTTGRSCDLQLRSYGGLARFAGPVRTVRCRDDNILAKGGAVQAGIRRHPRRGRRWLPAHSAHWGRDGKLGRRERVGGTRLQRSGP